MGHFLIFLYFFMFTNIGIPDIERRKRNLLIGQPQGSLSERIDTQCAFVDLKITFSCGLLVCHPCLNKKLKKKIQVAQNKCI